MAWSIFKIGCRVYSGVMAGVLLASFIGQALTGGIRIEPDPGHYMSPGNALTLVLWTVAIIITAVTKSETGE